MFRIGVDVGGTFTDFVIYNENEKKINVFKIPSSKNTPWLPIIKKIEKEIKDKDRIKNICHGTTIGINAVIERKGSRTALITTKGFRDLLEIGRQKRPHLYSLHVRKPPPLVPRHLRIPVTGRMDSRGRDIVKLSEREVLEGADKLKKENIESVAILFLNSYASGAHEDRAGRILKKKLPGAYISESFRVMPEFREYERLSTTVLNAYIGPVFKNYLENLLSGLKKIRIKAPLYICQSDGGLMSPGNVIKIPVRTLFSGPAAGVVGASFLYGGDGNNTSDKGRNNGNLITLDMGGTSTDVAVISGSKPVKTTEKEITGYPVKFPAVDVFTIGAGGGSIAAVDEGGFLKVGPESSGAEPGPACYGRGGTKPTVTDANLVLGTLGPGTMLGGKMKLDPLKAEEAVKKLISVPLDISLIKGAWIIVRLVASNIAEAIRKISISKGLHPEDLKIIASGGAGPMHAALVAKELDIREVIIPEVPGAFSAEGLLYGNATMDFVKTVKGIEKESLAAVTSNFKKKAGIWFEKENIPSGRQKLEWSLDMRYKGQNYELNIPVSDKDLNCIKKQGIGKIKEIFHRKHSAVYGYRLEDREIEMVNLRLGCTGFLSIEAGGRSGSAGRSSNKPQKPIRKFRKVYFNGEIKPVKTSVYKRHSLPCGFEISGPAIIEQMDSTIVIPPGDKGRVRSDGSIILNIF